MLRYCKRTKHWVIPRRNIIFERARFNSRKQEEDETVDAFVTALHGLAEHCNYGNLHNEMIRDRVVVGIRDVRLSERLQLDAKLTLETAVQQARQAEVIKSQQPALRGDPTPSNIGAVEKHKREAAQRATNPANDQPCSNCGGKWPHDRQNCPARSAICHRCKKRGHFQRVCRSVAAVNVRGVGTESHESDSNSDAFMGAFGSGVNDPWHVTLKLLGKPVTFYIDTGAEVTAVSERVWEYIGSPPLSTPDKILRCPDSHAMAVRGQFATTLGGSSQHTVYVVNELSKSLLGRPSIVELDLVRRINAIGFDPMKEFPSLFNGLGRMTGEYTIRLRDDAKPFVLTTPRRVAVPLQQKVKEELQRMESLGVIERVTQPTDWCAGMVVVPKTNGDVRICVDLTRLNESVRRERHPLPAVDHVLAQIAGAKIFSKLDANAGFWQIPLSVESALLTTFITPFGRFCFRRLPFGITSASEHFQRRMTEILAGLPGVVCLIDDMLVHGRSQEEHDEHLQAVLTRLSEAGVTLNRNKCKFSCTSVTFLGHVVDGDGIHPDPAKVDAIQKVEPPKSIGDVRRYLGMANQLSKFAPMLADITKPLRELLVKDNHWVWEKPQQVAFDKVKEILTNSPVLALYNPNLETVVSADASSYGLGAVLLQKQDTGDFKPVVYISRSLSTAEARYAQIEKESLAFTWACERLADYLIGLKFHIETDHKPLVPLFSTKNLEELPIRVQRFRMRMMRFEFTRCLAQN